MAASFPILLGGLKHKRLRADPDRRRIVDLADNCSWLLGLASANGMSDWTMGWTQVPRLVAGTLPFGRCPGSVTVSTQNRTPLGSFQEGVILALLGNVTNWTMQFECGNLRNIRQLYGL